MRRLLAGLLVLGGISFVLAQPGGGGPRPPSFDSPRPAASRSAEPKESVKPGALIDVEVVLAEWTEEEGQSLPGDATAKTISDRIAVLEKTGKMTVNKHIRLMTYENLPAFVQVGERRARVTGVTQTTRGSVSSVTMENVGMLLGVTPTLLDDRIALELNFEQSAPKKRADAPVLSETPDGEKIRSESTGTLTAQTTVSVKSGEQVVLSCIKEGGVQQVLLVTARVAK